MCLDPSADRPAELPIPGRVQAAEAALGAAVAEAPEVDLSWIGRELDSDGWAAAPDLLQLLYALVGAARPRHIVEFGSGVSTVVLARAAAQCGDCLITSFDHDPKFTQATAELLATTGDERIVSLQCAPLVARVRAGQLLPAYYVDSELVGSPRPADVILVDGPPAILGGRDGMIHQALEYAQAGTIILLDDANRDREGAALTEWQRLLGNAIQVHRPEHFSRGLAAIILAAPTTARIRATPAAA
jgi:predicted O-methyltransferase YrrM